MKKVHERWKEIDRSSAGRSPAIVTPPTRVVKPPASSDNASGPKQDRAKQVQQRSPTLHYSPPGKPVRKPALKAKTTAVKAKAAPKAAPDTKRVTISETPTQIEPKTPKGLATPKAETPDPTTSAAVKQALQRKATADLQATPAPPPSNAATSKNAPSDESNDNDGETNNRYDEDDAELSLEALRARNAARARWMRFSRSLKFKSIMPDIVVSFLSHKLLIPYWDGCHKYEPWVN